MWGLEVLPGDLKEKRNLFKFIQSTYISQSSPDTFWVKGKETQQILEKYGLYSFAKNKAIRWRGSILLLDENKKILYFALKPTHCSEGI